MTKNAEGVPADLIKGMIERRTSSAVLDAASSAQLSESESLFPKV